MWPPSRTAKSSARIGTRVLALSTGDSTTEETCTVSFGPRKSGPRPECRGFSAWSTITRRDALRDYLLAAVVMVASVAVQTTFTLAKTATTMTLRHARLQSRCVALSAKPRRAVVASTGTRRRSDACIGSLQPAVRSRTTGATATFVGSRHLQMSRIRPQRRPRFITTAASEMRAGIGGTVVSAVHIRCRSVRSSRRREVFSISEWSFLKDIQKLEKLNACCLTTSRR
mmetsp:Transcript_13146/g.31290  ORF Transcript_13146/g.31290 Transcript_13146/m.31290 type:complete len:228 (+) Transcript_13146:1302-1985(+)